MSLRHSFDYLLLAALWGGSFLLMRIAAPEFGAFALSGVRVFIAGITLLTVLVVSKRFHHLRTHYKPIAVVGVLNSAIPFLLFAYAMSYISSGLGSILNATVPLWGAIVAFVWLKDRMSALRIFGLLLGFVGVTTLVWDKVSLKPGAGLAVVACLFATFCYGIAANFTKKYLAGVDTMSSATGSQLAAACVLLPLAVATWPNHTISIKAWLCVAALAIFCTAFAYILYFRLFAALGPSKTMTVTFLIPVFGMTWGAIFLGETITIQMLVACGIVLIGTAVTTGLIAPKTKVDKKNK
jgi:drug/metabolite transporter (DMT)-like permease